MANNNYMSSGGNNDDIYIPEPKYVRVVEPDENGDRSHYRLVEEPPTPIDLSAVNHGDNDIARVDGPIVDPADLDDGQGVAIYDDDDGSVLGYQYSTSDSSDAAGFGTITMDLSDYNPVYEDGKLIGYEPKDGREIFVPIELVGKDAGDGIIDLSAYNPVYDDKGRLKGYEPKDGRDLFVPVDQDGVPVATAEREYISADGSTIEDYKKVVGGGVDRYFETVSPMSEFTTYCDELSNLIASDDGDLSENLRLLSSTMEDLKNRKNDRGTDLSNFLEKFVNATAQNEQELSNELSKEAKAFDSYIATLNSLKSSK